MTYNQAQLAENSWERANRIADWLKQRINIQPKVAVVLGSGLGLLAESLTDTQTFPYSTIPEFPVSTVSGHKGNLLFGKVSNGSSTREVVLMQGRFHAYEGYSSHLVTLPMRVFKLIGCDIVLLTNAAGSLSDKYNVGDVMLLNSHINLPGLSGFHPLYGPNDENRGPRFLSTSDTYDANLRKQLSNSLIAKSFPGEVHVGVYVYQTGPCYESVAEVRMMALLGGDAVGMSTVPEALVAHHSGMRVAAMSLITNQCITDYSSDIAANHKEVMEVADMRAKALKEVVLEFLVNLV